ncbi:MAG: FHA domain-containing protein [Paracoccaceae bacterium]
MDFIHKIIAERRAARMTPPGLPADEPEAGLADWAAGQGSDSDLPRPQARPPQALVAPAWTNPNAADLPPLLLTPQERLDPAPPRSALPAAVAAPVRVPDPTPASAARLPAPPPAWDHPLPLRAAPPPMAVAAPEPLFDDEAAFAPSPAAAAFAPPPRADEVLTAAARAARRPTGVLNDAGVQMPPPAAGRGASLSGHVKTRMLGFDPETLGLSDPFTGQTAPAAGRFPVGWMVVVGGPGLGSAFMLRDGVARIGRGEDQEVSLNFGDNAISRDNHVSVAFDAEQKAFYVGQSGRSNIARLNERPLLSTERLTSGDQIRIGETTLRFAALCGEDFAWSERA